jgi:hypothetical protein
MKKLWQEIDIDDCPECGGTLHSLTVLSNGSCLDGDAVQCLDCDFISAMSVCGETGESWVQER